MSAAIKISSSDLLGAQCAKVGGVQEQTEAARHGRGFGIGAIGLKSEQ
jgi:hypothetical protein